jgi:hypothetical protein
VSVEAINWALSQDIERSSEKFVLVVMANRCNDQWLCWPSISSIVEDTSQNRKTVQENLARLKNSGLICANGMRKGATGSVVVYALSRPENGLSKQAQKRTEEDVEAGPKTVQLETEAGPKTDISRPENGHEAGPKTGYGTISEPSGTGKPKNITPRRKPEGFDFNGRLLAEGVAETAARDWATIRKVKKLPATQTAFEGLLRESAKAGVTLQAAVTECCERGWGGFKAEWLANSKARAGPSATPAKINGSTRQSRIDSYWNQRYGNEPHQSSEERDITGESERVA